MSKSIAIIGGGAGGICAALGAMNTAKVTGEAIEVHLFERNPRLGIKILISGGGKCNITHAGPVDEVLREGFPHVNERRFLKSAMYRYTNEDILSLLERHGVLCHARDNGRVFPNSGRAEDVLMAFESELRNAGVVVHTKTRIEKIDREGSGWNILSSERVYSPDALILATGGTSYSKTGTSGDGIRYAMSLGHTIVPLRSALAPIYLKRVLTQELVGIALRNIIIYVARDHKVLATVSGDVLLTHRGLSGPAVLGISREAASLITEGPIAIQVNILARDESDARDMIVFEQQSRGQQQVKTWIEELLPNRFAPYVLAQAEIPFDRKWNALTREERTRMLTALTRYDFGAVSEVPLERGEVTAGGVSLKELDPKTMMSRIIPGLFFAGEMLDIAGEIGGYNLQAAYSTGWVAGEEAMKLLARAK